MTGKPSSIVIDTNVWLDHYLPGRAGSAAATACIEAAFRQNVTLLYTAAQAKDIFFLVGANLKALERATHGTVTQESAAAINEMCWRILDNLDEFATIVGSDASDAWIAKKYKNLHRDFEDNLVIAAVQRSHADMLITSDESLIKHAPVATVSPQSLTTILEAFPNESLED